MDQAGVNRRQRRFEGKGKAEQIAPPEIVQPSAEKRFDRPRLFRITGGANLRYTGVEQIIDKDKWLMEWPLIDKNSVEVDILDLAGERELSTNDIIVGFPVIDNAGIRRFVGFSPKYAWWHL